MRDAASTSSIAESYVRLLSLAVHEFRTPASVVGGYLRMLQRDGDGPLTERQRKMIAEAEKSCARLVALISELSEISKLDGGTASVKDERVDLFEMLSELASTVHEADDRGVRLQVRGDTAGAFIQADRVLIRTAYESIFRAVLREQPADTVVVIDHRIGHPAVVARSAVVVVARAADVQAAYDARPGVFDEKRGGLGLALPIARRVVERYGGRLWSPLTSGSDGEPSRGAIVAAVPLAG